ncbi:CDP-glucose 4,6-dehydratase [Paracraurococcus lichenis]|uniref:CDP-glucose 4,6-dehydratase n=1 Tax=Paracraurococcus lichenis TaxID=3064888 RepID=A0ABT9DSV6_9PROT|nr:CDP-glucose 4,6-dehydratase [Paracraurococcus sp. LOR1-02]MDO9706981.1 CDP-glucose 4,6-dehydratase [Paracraurococcus sp. LOR1-02]
MVHPRPGFWRGRRVLVTGHTGFKGSWLCLLLQRLGAEVTGIALDPYAGPTAFAAMRIGGALAADHRADVRDRAGLAALVRAARPELVLQLAAQPFVGRSYREPEATFATNCTGTIHLLEALRGLGGIAAAVFITSDKVYRNDGAGRAFLEDDPLGGHDPYSASKAAAEMAVQSWRASFAADLPPIATARAGNVIGGGDFGEQRIIPDLVRAEVAGEALLVRRPDATRPFQHVLDVLRGYLLLAERLAEAPRQAPAALNFGPLDGEIRVRELLDRWGAATGRPVAWRQETGPVMAEAPRLGLDSTLAARVLGWQPAFPTPEAIAETARWYAAWRAGEDTRAQALAAIDRVLAA